MNACSRRSSSNKIQKITCLAKITLLTVMRITLFHLLSEELYNIFDI